MYTHGNWNTKYKCGNYIFAETNIIESTRVQDVDKMTLISENSPVVTPSNRYTGGSCTSCNCMLVCCGHDLATIAGVWHNDFPK